MFVIIFVLAHVGRDVFGWWMPLDGVMERPMFGYSDSYFLIFKSCKHCYEMLCGLRYEMRYGMWRKVWRKLLSEIRRKMWRKLCYTLYFEIGLQLSL